MADPLVSIVIATRERPALLQRAIASILKQSLRELEILVVDDGSAQPTLDAYLRAGGQADPRVAYHLAAEAPRLVRGVCAARNYGLSLARAPYIVFFDDDDEMSVEDHLEVAVKYHRMRPRCLYFGDIKMLSEGAVAVDARMRPFDSWMLHQQACEHPPIYNPSIEQFSLTFAHRYPHLNATLLDTQLVREIGGFAETLIFCEDLNMFLRYADVCSTVFYRREAVIDFDVTPRPRMFEAPHPVSRDLMTSLALSHARITVRSPHLLQSSIKIESHMLASAARKLRADGNRVAARFLARESLALRSSRLGIQQYFGSFWK